MQETHDRGLEGFCQVLGYSELVPERPNWRQRIATIALATIGITLIFAAVAFSWAGSPATITAGGFVVTIGMLLCALSRTQWLWLKTRVTVMLMSLALIVVVTDISLRVTTALPINETSNTIPHDDLGYVLNPDMADVDANGFRNRNINESVNIVTIGDSHTQGFGVASQHSWPQVLGGLMNQTVYNFGVGGYGPLQYEYIIEKALALNPQTIVIGLYAGNDFADAAKLKEPEVPSLLESNPFRHAIKYKTAVGSLCQQFIIRTGLRGELSTTIDHELNPTVISDRRLHYLSEATDLSVAEIKRGFMTTLHILDEANQRCANQNCQLVVLIIPTREFVYGTVVESAELPENYANLIRNEGELHQEILKAMTNQKITHASALPCLQSAMTITANVYPTFDDGHPRESGYVAYAAAVVRVLSPAVAQR